MSYFERPANLMSKEVRPAYLMSNIEIPHALVARARERRSCVFGLVEWVLGWLGVESILHPLPYKLSQNKKLLHI